jgi:hypothetical protein
LNAEDLRIRVKKTMNKKIYFKFNGGKIGDPFNPAMGWLAVGPHPLHQDGTDLLSIECHDVADVEANAKNLKQLIDDAVRKARKKLPR